MMQALPKTYTDLTAQGYFNAEIKPLGFTALTLPDTAASAATFQLNKGHSIWGGVFRSYASGCMGETPHMTADNRLVVEALTGDDPFIISNEVTKTGVARFTARWNIPLGEAVRFPVLCYS